MSIRLRLFISLVLMTGFIWLCATVWIGISTKNRVENVLDARLIGAAHMVNSLINEHYISVASAANVVSKKNFPKSLSDKLREDDIYNRQLSCQIWSLQGQLLSKSESAPDSPLVPHTSGFQEAEIDGARWRVYVVLNEALGIRVLIGDRIEVRDELISDVIKGFLIPGVITLPVLAVIIWISLKLGLGPIRRLAASLSDRRPTELHPFEEKGAPDEIRPMIHALNSLLQRVGEMRNKEKNFTTYAAHELKTPLAGLKTQVQIAMRAKDPFIQKKTLHQITQSVDRTSRMVRQLIDMAFVDDDTVQDRVEQVEIAALFHDIQLELEPLIQQKSVSVVYDFTQRPVIMASSAMLSLAFRNIIENAVQHTPENSQILVKIADKETCAQIDITDQGKGIPSDKRLSVTERFFKNPSKEQAGSGLGLAIVQMALDRMQGKLEFSGTTGCFTVCVKLPKG